MGRPAGEQARRRTSVATRNHCRKTTMPARANMAAPAQPHHSPPAPIANPAPVNSAHRPASRSNARVGSAPARRNMRSRPFRGVRSGSSLTVRTVPPQHRHQRGGEASSARRGPWSRAGRPGTTRRAPVGIRRFDRLRATTTWRAGALVDVEPVTAFERGRLDAHLVRQNGHDLAHLLAVRERDHRPTPDVIDGPRLEGLATVNGWIPARNNSSDRYVADPGDHLLVEQGGSNRDGPAAEPAPVRRLHRRDRGSDPDRVERGDRPRPPG